MTESPGHQFHPIVLETLHHSHSKHVHLRSQEPVYVQLRCKEYKTKTTSAMLQEPCSMASTLQSTDRCELRTLHCTLANVNFHKVTNSNEYE